MGTRRKLIGRFSGILDDDDGRHDIEIDLSCLATMERAVWFVNGGIVLSLLGPALIANDIYLNAFRGLAVTAEPTIDDDFERFYALPVESYTT